jgi:hypothetical protein
VTTAFGGGVSFFNFDPGDGYAVGPITTSPAGPQPGSGSGFALNVTAVVPCSAGGSTGYVNITFGGPSNN